MTLGSSKTSFAVGLAVLFPVLKTVMLAVVSVAVILFYVEREEEALIARYGKAYREYMRKIPRSSYLRCTDWPLNR